MFCPKCKYEYEGGIFKCPDCDEYLVNELKEDAEEQTEKDYNWIQLARLNSDQYSQMLKDVLDQKNIPVVIHSGTGHFGVLGQMGVNARPVGGGFSFFVPEEFVLEAHNEGLALLGEEWENACLIDIDEE